MSIDERPSTPQELMRKAASQVETALILLNMRNQTCRECGSVHHENRTHWKVHQAFADAPRRLREAAARLENEDTDESTRR